MSLPKHNSPIYSHTVQGQLKPLSNIKNIIAIGAGKGGVGKSTVSFQLARTLAKQGLSVGLIDADIYGPSLPTLTQNSDRAFLRHDKKFQPHFYDNIHYLSIGHLVDAHSAMLWRGPMACGALLQLFQQTAWPELDFLIVDLPPGTGDILLTVCQKIPLTGVLLVTHPHQLAYADYLRAETMFEKLNIFSLGVVLNQYEEHTLDYKNVVAHIPYDMRLRHSFHLSDDLLSQYFLPIAQSCLDAIAQRPLALSIPLKVL